MVHAHEWQRRCDRDVRNNLAFECDCGALGWKRFGDSTVRQYNNSAERRRLVMEREFDARIAADVERGVWVEGDSPRTVD